MSKQIDAMNGGYGMRDGEDNKEERKGGGGNDWEMGHKKKMSGSEQVGDAEKKREDGMRVCERVRGRGTRRYLCTTEGLRACEERMMRRRKGESREFTALVRVQEFGPRINPAFPCAGRGNLWVRRGRL